MPRNGRSMDLYSGPQPFFCHQGPASREIIFPRTGGRWFQDDSVQFSSVTQSCPTLCNPMNRSTPGLPVHHQLPEFTQTHILRVSDAIQPSISSSVVPFSSCPQSLPASESFPMSQIFAWGGQSTGVSALASFPPEMQNKNNNKVTLHTCLNGYHQNIYK